MSLEEWVKEWANNNDDRTKKWLNELKSNDIDAIQDLESLDDESFTVLISALKETKFAVLMQKLKHWYENRNAMPIQKKRKIDPDLELLKYAFKPIKVHEILNYQQLVGKHLHVENAEKMWSTNRKHLNQDSSILMTPQIIKFIDYLRQNFEGSEPIWDGLLVRGISGCGKSVEFAVGASYLDSLGLFDVYWIRSGEDYEAISSSIWKPISQNTGEKYRIIFIDQADKLGNKLDIFIGRGSQDKGIFTLGCASGNARVEPSSSRATRIREYISPPSVDFGIFLKFFSSNQMHSNEYDLPKFESTRAMLDYEVTDLPSLYVGTSGHFLSMARIRAAELNANNSDRNIKSSWNSVLVSLSEEMSLVVSGVQVENKSLFYAHLHRMILLNPDQKPYFDANSSPDDRFIHEFRIFSPLFAQAYRIMLLSQPPSKSLCASLRNLSDSENPSIRGFYIERYVLNEIFKLEEPLIRILPFINTIDTPKRSGIFCFGDLWSLPSEILEFSEFIRIWLFIPLKWNEKNVDAVFIITQGKNAAVIGIQITLESASRHSNSLDFFVNNSFEGQLAADYDVLPILIFVCNRDACDLKTRISGVDDKLVYDFPLYAFLDDFLDEKIIKGHGSSLSLRKLSVNSIGSVQLLTCKDMEKASYSSLLAFCKEFGTCQFPKKPTKKEVKEKAYRVHVQHNPCSDCRDKRTFDMILLNRV
jgi:hypothetical protein